MRAGLGRNQLRTLASRLRHRPGRRRCAGGRLFLWPALQLDRPDARRQACMVRHRGQARGQSHEWKLYGHQSRQRAGGARRFRQFGTRCGLERNLMERQQSSPRADWQAKFAALGFSFHSADGGYWNEAACYRFSSDEIDELEAATLELQRLALTAVKHIIGENLCAKILIPPAFVPLVEKSWLDNAPSLYGRFDLAYNGREP